MEHFDSSYDDITLVDSIRKISSRISLYGSKQDAVHSQFLSEVVEDMEEQVELLQYSPRTSS
jgi:bacterioferritin (cytochrome b1)